MISTRSVITKAAMPLALAAAAGTALAQTGTEKPGPMPAAIPKLGDPDAVCFFGSTMAAAAVSKAAGSAPADMREGVVELAWRQMAFYIGKVSGRYPEPQAGDLVTATSSKFMAKDNAADQRPIMTWCLRSYVAETSTFQTRLGDARKLAERGPGPKAALLRADTLDADALCFALIGIALPQTMEAAKTNPKAALGVQQLGRSQHYYMGRLLTKPHKVSIEQSIADAWDYGAALSTAKDNTTGHAQVSACVNDFRKTSAGFFTAAEKGLPKSG